MDTLPHKCCIFRLANQPDGLGGSSYVAILEQSNLECWEQQASASEKLEYQKKEIDIGTKVYFVDNPNVTERHKILITERFGVAAPNLDIDDVGNPDVFDVASFTYPDASAGLGVLFKVLCKSTTGATE